MNEASFWKDLPLALAAGFAAFMLFFVILLLGFEFIEWKKEGLRSDEVEKNR